MTLAAVLLAALLASDDPTPLPSPQPADCSIVDQRTAGSILGFPVGDPDQASQLGGICFYAARDLSDEGTLSYAVVTPVDLPARRSYFRAFSRRCAAAAKGTLNELACRQFIALGAAETIDDYFTARQAAGDASPAPQLGDAAVTTANAVYVKRGGAVYEASVSVRGDFDLAKSAALMRRLLDAGASKR